MRRWISIRMICANAQKSSVIYKHVYIYIYAYTYIFIYSHESCVSLQQATQLESVPIHVQSHRFVCPQMRPPVQWFHCWDSPGGCERVLCTETAPKLRVSKMNILTFLNVYINTYIYIYITHRTYAHDQRSGAGMMYNR